MVVNKNLTAAKPLQSKAVFDLIAERVAADPEKAKTVNGVFAYRITVDGKVVSDWSK